MRVEKKKENNKKQRKAVGGVGVGWGENAMRRPA